MKKKSSKSNKDDFAREFNRRKPIYEQLKSEAIYTIEKKLKESGIKIHSIPSRVKDLDSFLDKIERKQYENPFEQIQDFVGLRVICLFLSDIPKIGEIIDKHFSIVESEDKVDGGDTSSFGYMSVHHIVKYSDDVKGDRYDDIKAIPFEIQVRTIAMDAWANISHYLEYKTEQDIPDELKRDFNALSGMFYVADKHFQLFFEQRREKQEEITETFEKGNEEEKFNQPINLDTITVYLREKFPLRQQGTSEYISRFVDELEKSGYKTIGEVEKVINNGLKAALAYEKASETNYLDVGIARVLFSIVDDKYLQVWQIQNHPNFDESSLQISMKNFKETYEPYYKMVENRK